MIKTISIVINTKFNIFSFVVSKRMLIFATVKRTIND